MKRLLASILALAMCCAMAVPVFAATIDQDSQDKTGSTAVSFEVAPAYTVTIPETVELGRVDTNGTITYENDATITAAAGVRLLNGQKIQVTIDSDFTLTANNTDLAYTISVNNNEVAQNGVVAEFGTGTQAQSSTIHFAAADPEYAGNYSDTVTFTLQVTDSAGFGSGIEDWEEVDVGSGVAQ